MKYIKKLNYIFSTKISIIDWISDSIDNTRFHIYNLYFPPTFLSKFVFFFPLICLSRIPDLRGIHQTNFRKKIPEIHQKFIKKILTIYMMYIVCES